MTTAVIVDAVRTAGGKRNGKLRNWHAVDLASEPLIALQARNDLDPALVDDVITGCVMQVGEQGLNIAAAPCSPRLARERACHHHRPPVRLVQQASTSPPRASWPAPTTSSSPRASRA